jgi:hypothetical protein
MITRPFRLYVALLAACAIAFAQIAVAAQPWPLAAVAHHQSVPGSDADSPDAFEPCVAHLTGDLAAPGQPDVPSPNHCEVRCQDAAQPDIAPVGAAAPVVDAWLAVPVAATLPAQPWRTATIDAKCASPPARVMFGRFLI